MTTRRHNKDNDMAIEPFDAQLVSNHLPGYDEGNYGAKNSYTNDVYEVLSHEQSTALAKQQDNHEEKIGHNAEQHLKSMLYEWFAEARTTQAGNRYEQALDEDYYDGEQLSDEELAELAERGQPPVIYNIVKGPVDWLTGTERKTRVDWSVLPREKDDQDGAMVKTKLLKYIQDVNDASYHRSRGFKDACKVGVGWLEDGIRTDPFDEPLYSRYESWRNMWYDHLGKEPDTSDWRYEFRGKWVDEEVGIAYFPEFEHKIRSAAYEYDTFYDQDDDLLSLQPYYSMDKQFTSSTSVDVGITGKRRRVFLVECWYRKPERGQWLNTRDKELWQVNGAKYDEGMPNIDQFVEDGTISLYDGVRQKVRVAIALHSRNDFDCILQDIPSPYMHDQFPFTPIWGYRKGRDGAPYGVIRTMRDPQSAHNKRMQKAIHILSTTRVTMDKGAVEDKEELREEVGRPDAIIEKKRGSELKIDTDNQLAQQHILLAQMDKEFIHDVGGTTAENLGLETNATSGKAIIARQQQGATTTMELFDNLRLATKWQGEKQLSNMEMVYSEQKTIRISGARPEYITINEQGDTGVKNDITSRKADFVVSDQDYRASVRAAMFDMMVDMIGKIAVFSPEGAMALLDLVVEMSDVPNRDEWVNRIRQITGQRDPESEPTPKEIQAEQAAMKEEDEMKAIQKTAVLTSIDKERKQAEKLAADSMLAKMKALTEARDSTLIMQSPQLAAAIDQIIDFVNTQIRPEGE